MLEITFALLAVIIVFWVIWRKRRFSVFKEMGIPGPEPNFFFGNMWELSKKTPLECHKEWIEKYGNVVGYFFGGSPVVLVADADLLRKIQVSNFQHFINRPGIMQIGRRDADKNDELANQLTALKDKRWKQIRSTLTPTFTTSKLKTMAPLINDAIDTLIENVDQEAKSGRSFNIYKMYQGLTMDVIGRTAFGIQTDCQNNPNDPFLRSSRVLLAGNISSMLALIAFSFPEFGSIMLTIRRLNQIFKNKGVNPMKTLVDSVRNVITTRRNNPQLRRPDLLQTLIDAKVEQEGKVKDDDLTAGDEADARKEESGVPKPISTNVRNMKDQEILDNSILFFLAGYETTSTALAYATHFIVKYQEVQNRVREEIQSLVEKEGKLNYVSVQQLQYLDQVITESLRLYPPIYLFVNREVGKDTQLGDLHLKKGMAVQIPTYTIQHNEEYWPDPETFDPERFAPENKGRNHPMAYQVFGNGPRNCVGMRFAQMEAKLALAKLLLKYKLEPSKDTEDVVTLNVSAATLTPKKGIFLKAVAL